MAKNPIAVLDPTNLPKAKTAPGAVPSLLSWKDAEGVEQETSIHDVVMAYDPEIHGPWRSESGKGKHNGGFYNGETVCKCIDRKLTVNETGLRLLDDGKVVDIAASMAAHAQTWQIVSSRWSTDKGYGNQHFTKFGPMHTSAVDRLSSEGIAMNAVCFVEILSQRAAMVGMVTSDVDKAECVAAANFLRGLVSLIGSRPQVIKDTKKKQIYKAAIDLDGEKSLQNKSEASA